MKRVALLLLLAACQPGGEVIPPSPSTTELPVETVTAGEAFRWNEGDCIHVNGKKSSPLDASATGATSAVFTLQGELEGECCAAFPASAVSAYRDATATVSLPVAQRFYPTAPDPSAFLLLGKGTTEGVVLSPAVAIVAVSVTGDCSLSRITLTAHNATKRISGFFVTDFMDLSNSSGVSYNYVTATAQEGAPAGSTFRLCVMPADFRDGLQCRIEDTQGRAMTLMYYPRTPFSPGQTYPLEVEYVPGEHVDPGPPEEGMNGLTVATVNLLKPSGRRSEMSLKTEYVRLTLGRSVSETGADLVAFNELDENFLPGAAYDLQASCRDLPDYWRWSLAWPNKLHSDSPPTYSYANGFAYNSSVLRLEESTYVWLSKNSEGWYTSPAAAYQMAGSPERTCLSARFTHLASGRQFWFFVTHLPTESQGGGAMMAGGVNRYAASVAGAMPCILAGDMNSGPGGSNQVPYARLRTAWADAWESVLEQGQLGIYETYNGTLSGSSDSYYYTWDKFTKNRPDRRIDHLLCAGAMHAVSYRMVVVYYFRGGKYWCPSDHLPVVAHFQFD